jgi:RHS repeat-associated protein
MSIGSLRIGVPSPTASSLGKFGDIPVSLYTGLPDIELPLYTVNVTALKRYNQSGSLLHNYTYTYYSGTNRLRRVTGSSDRYVYDSNGNVRHDLDNNIGFVIYDIFNLPVTVYTTGGDEHLYYYDHNGNRVRKRIGGSSDYYVNGIDGRTEVVTNNNGSWATYSIYGLDLIGQVRRDGITWNRFYFLKDHLGSIKVVVNASGNVVAYDDYYPFGYILPGRSQGSESVDGRYKFTGKERDTETSYDYFGARYYDARVGRFLTVDLLSDDDRLIGWSPYHYGYNNPVRFIDIKGMQPEDNINIKDEQILEARLHDVIMRGLRVLYNIIHGRDSMPTDPAERAHREWAKEGMLLEYYEKYPEELDAAVERFREMVELQEVGKVFESAEPDKLQPGPKAFELPEEKEVPKPPEHRLVPVRRRRF